MCLINEQCNKQIKSIQFITDNIAIGNVNSLSNNELKRNKITYILNLSGQISPVDIPCMNVFIRDEPIMGKEYIKVLLKMADLSYLIDKLLKLGHTVLINCYAGINRSATLITCYMILYENIKPKSAIQIIRKKNSLVKRPALTNESFVSLIYSIYELSSYVK